MIVLATLLAIVIASAQGCDLPLLCSKMDILVETTDNTDKQVKIVENKVDIVDMKIDRLLLSIRLQLTLLDIDTSQFDVSDIYDERIYLASKTEAPFDIDSANNECKSQGGYLLELDNNEERMFTWDFVEKIGGATHFATGGNDITTEGIWVYYNSGKPRPSDLQWLAGEPNDSGGNEDCMVFWMAKQGLNDIPCNHSIKYVCEVPLRVIA